MSFHGKIEEDAIRIGFKYNPEYVRQIKEVPGRRYDPQTRTWLIPKPQWRTFRRIFRGVPVQFPAEQTEELWLLEHPSYVEPVSQVDGFKGILYPFQAEGVSFLTSRKRCLLADEFGLGKTVTSIAAALELQNRNLARHVLVFCPKTLVPQWMSEYKQFIGKEAVAIAGTKSQREQAYREASDCFFAVTNYATVLREAEKLADLKPEVVVLDEAQRIKNYRAKTTREIKKHFRTAYRWALTGTPLENSLAELHSIMEWIDPGILGSWWRFKEKYLIYGGYEGKKIVGYRNLPELRGQLEGWMLRRRKRDVLPELPDIVVNNYYISLTRNEKAIYSTIRRKVGKLYRNYRRTRRGSGEVLAKLMFLRESCDHPALVADVMEELGYEFPLAETSSKLEELLQIIQDLSGEKIVVYSEFTSLQPYITERLNLGYLVMHGGLTQTQRVKALDAFNNDPDCQVLICQDKVAGVGLNLQAARYAVNYELHWNPQRVKQRVGRLHRMGQKDTVFCINLIAEGTIEERVLKVINEKTNLFRKVIEADFSSPVYQNAVWRILDEEFGGG